MLGGGRWKKEGGRVPRETGKGRKGAPQFPGGVSRPDKGWLLVLQLLPAEAPGGMAGGSNPRGRQRQSARQLKGLRLGSGAVSAGVPQANMLCKTQGPL